MVKSIFEQAPAWQKFIILATAGTIFVITAAGKVGYADSGSQPDRIGVVIVDRLNLRPSPGTSEAPVTVLQRGDTLSIIEETPKWWIVSLSGQIGYISRQDRFLRVVADPEAGETAEAGGSPQAPADIDRLNHQAEEIQRQIADRQATVAAVAEAEQQTLNRLNTAAKAAAASKSRLKRLRVEIKSLKQKIAATEDAAEALQERTARDAEDVKNRVVALYKLNRLGSVHLLTSAQSVSDFHRRQSALESILAWDQHRLAAYAERKTLLQNLLADLQKKRAQKQNLEQSARAALEAAIRERKKKKQLLARVRNDKSLELASLSALEQAQKALDRAMDGLGSQPIQGVPAKNRPSSRFSESKGLLKLPAKGKILLFFGPYRHPTYKVTNFHGGIDIQAGLGEPVSAVWSGKVVFSDWFQGYGNLIILDHGDSYYTLYGHLEERFKHKGDPVEAGEVIATVGDTGPVSDSRLHFQVRHHGKALDPLEWVRKGS